MNRFHMTAAASAALCTALLLGGCEQPNNNAGPAQQAGKAIDDVGAKVAGKVQEQVVKADEATQKVRENVKDATAEARSNLDRATEAVGKKVEHAGEKIQQAAQ
jgi:uncharacterized protein YjbJ (UPF0337 family)